MTNNTIHTNTGTYGVNDAPAIGPLMQGQAGVIMTFTLTDLGGTVVNLTGLTITGTITNNQTKATAALAGAIALVTPASGIFSWTTDATDVGTAGSFKIIFTVGSSLITLPAHLAIVETPAATTTFGAALVGVTVAQAAWLATALATMADAADLANVPDPAGATASYVWTADGADSADWAAAASGVSDVGDLTTTTGNSTEILRVAAAGGLEYRTTAQVLSDIGAATAQAITAGTVVSRDGKKVTYNTQGVITAVAAMDYGDLVRSTQPWNLIGYWPLNETSGVVAANNALSGSGFNGAYEGPTLNSTAGPAGLGNAPLFDASNDYVNIDSASLDAATNFDELTFFGWFKVASAGVWTDAAFRCIVSASNNESTPRVFEILRKNTNDVLRFSSTVGGSSYTTDYTVPSPGTGWYPVAWRRSVTANEQSYWMSGVRVSTSTTATSAATSWSVFRLGMSYAGVTTNPWSGYLAHCAIWRGALTTAEILALSKAILFT